MSSIEQNLQLKKETLNGDADVACDVLVIGGGGAGLAAAIEAADNEAHVILIEKNPELGGTTAFLT